MKKQQNDAILVGLSVQTIQSFKVEIHLLYPNAQAQAGNYYDELKVPSNTYGEIKAGDFGSETQKGP